MRIFVFTGLVVFAGLFGGVGCDSQSSSDANSAGNGPAFEAFEDEAAGLWGYRDADGNVAIEPRYKIAGDFSGPIAGVVDGQGWAIINAQGTVLLRPFVFDNGPDEFAGGLARFVDAKGRMGYYNPRGEIVIPAEFDFAEPFANGSAIVCMGCKLQSDRDEHHKVVVGGEWGRIDPSGEFTARPGTIERD